MTEPARCPFRLFFDHPKKNNGVLIEHNSLNKLVYLCSFPKATQIMRVKNKDKNP